MSDTYNIIISGEGGQGVLSIAKIIAKAAWVQGKQTSYVPYFSTEKRGGISTAMARIGDVPISFPKFGQADLWVALSQRAVERIKPFLKDDSVVIVNSFLVKDVSAIVRWHPYEIDATTIAKEQLKKPRTFNMIIMGAMLNFVPDVSKDGFEAALEKQFKDKYERDSELKEMNHQAFEIGFNLIEK